MLTQTERDEIINMGTNLQNFATQAKMAPESITTEVLKRVGIFRLIEIVKDHEARSQQKP